MSTDRRSPRLRALAGLGLVSVLLPGRQRRGASSGRRPAPRCRLARVSQRSIGARTGTPHDSIMRTVRARQGLTLKIPGRRGRHLPRVGPVLVAVWSTALAGALLLAGCAKGNVPPTAPSAPPGTAVSPASGAPVPGTSEDRALVDAGYHGRYRASATVLEAPGKGPQLCLGVVTASLPPLCGGPTVIGWSWEAAPHATANGVRWGSYVVTGRYDGTSFTLTEPALLPSTDVARPPLDNHRFDSPCHQPPGSWVPTDPAKATDAAFAAATELAQKQESFGALWIDQKILPGTATAGQPAGANDPTRFVLNISTTKDVAAMERTVRTVWGGSLCVSHAVRTAAELQRVMEALKERPGMLSGRPDGLAGYVRLDVVQATTQQQRQLDQRFGTGVVKLSGALKPID